MKRCNSAADILDERGDASTAAIAIHPAQSDAASPDATNHNAQPPPRKSLGQPLRVERRGGNGPRGVRTVDRSQHCSILVIGLEMVSDWKQPWRVMNRFNKFVRTTMRLFNAIFFSIFLSATEFTIPWRTIIRHGGCRLCVCLSVCVSVCVSRGKLCYWVTFERFELEG